MKKQIKTEEIKKHLADKNQEINKKETYLLNTGAKAIYNGGGWWTIYSYAYDGSDIAGIG